MIIDRALVYDTREVSVTISDVPVLFTPSGNNPIDPYHVSFAFNIPRRAITRITVLGRPTPDSAPSWRLNRRYVRRRVNEVNAPAWVRELIEEYRP